MARKIQIKRGNKANLPTLSAGELALTLDEQGLYGGTGSANIPLGGKAITPALIGAAPLDNAVSYKTDITEISDLATTPSKCGLWLSNNGTTTGQPSSWAGGRKTVVRFRPGNDQYALDLLGGYHSQRLAFRVGASNTFREVYDTAHVPETTYTATIPANSSTYSGGYYYTDVAVAGILASDKPIVDVVCGTDATANANYIRVFSQIDRIVTSADSIRVYSTALPNVNTPIQLKVVR